MDYLWLKIFHIVAIVTWIGGMLTTSLTLAATRGIEVSTDRSKLIYVIRQWDRRLTTPAMFLVWALGLSLAFEGGWFTAPWLLMKLALVFVLSALHGLLSGTLRRLTRADEASPPVVLTYAPVAIMMLILGIITLAVIKPF